MTAIESRDGHNPPANLSELRYEIAQTRADLGATVEALAAKTDVKARAHDAVAEAKSRARETVGQAVDGVKGRTQSGMGRLVQSVREHPAPWVLGTGLILLAAVIAPNRRQLAGALAGPRSRRLATRRVAHARGPLSGSRRWWR